MGYPLVRCLGRLLACAALTSILGLRTAEAATIDFESLANSGAGFYDVSKTYTEDGFTLAVFDPDSNPFVTFGSGETRYGGSPALYNNNVNGGTRLTRDGGGTFSISSIDLAGDTRFGTIPVTFVGTKSDATTVQLALVLTNSQLQSFAFGAEFTDLVKLEWRQVTPFHQFDNIVVEPLATTAPEPATLLLLGLGLGGASRRLRTRKRRAADGA